MKLRDDDRRWLADEVSGQVKQAFADTIDEFRPHGWKRVTNFIREWGIAGAIIAVFAALLGIAAAAFYQATARVGKEAIFETNTGRDLEEIRKEIKAIQGDLALQGLINHASLPLSEFKVTLPAVGSAIAKAKQQEVKAATKVIDNLQQKLIASGESSPGYWPAAAAFISYRSFDKASGTLTLPMPNCTDHKPNPAKVKSVEDEHHMTIENSVYENCRFTLDSPLDNERINELLMNEATGITFKHCVVTYSGGEINLVVSFHDRPVMVTAVHGGKPIKSTGTVNNPSTLRFDNCLFEFNFSGTPPLPGQQLTQAILATNASSLNFLIQKPSTHS